jgi:hypothetical protein
MISSYKVIIIIKKKTHLRQSKHPLFHNVPSADLIKTWIQPGRACHSQLGLNHPPKKNSFVTFEIWACLEINPKSNASS